MTALEITLLVALAIVATAFVLRPDWRGWIWKVGAGVLTGLSTAFVQRKLLQRDRKDPSSLHPIPPQAAPPRDAVRGLHETTDLEEPEPTRDYLRDAIPVEPDRDVDVRARALEAIERSRLAARAAERRRQHDE